LRDNKANSHRIQTGSSFTAYACALPMHAPASELGCMLEVQGLHIGSKPVEAALVTPKPTYRRKICTAISMQPREQIQYIGMSM